MCQNSKLNYVYFIACILQNLHFTELNSDYQKLENIDNNLIYYCYNKIDNKKLTKWGNDNIKKIKCNLKTTTY